MEETRELDNWISVREAAALSGYATEYIRELARKGAIRSEKIGPVFAIHRQDLERYIKDKKTQVN